MADYRLDPQGIRPSDTDGEVITTVGGVTTWAPGGASGSALLPLTTTVAGEPVLVWDDNDELVLTEVPL